jgi:hypothetical protein
MPDAPLIPAVGPEALPATGAAALPAALLPGASPVLRPAIGPRSTLVEAVPLAPAAVALCDVDALPLPLTGLPVTRPAPGVGVLPLQAARHAATNQRGGAPVNIRLRDG